MTQEEKAKAYDEALERATNWYNANTNEGFRGIFEDIFPQLTKIKDERIRKCIRLCLDECVHSDIIRDYERDECLAYLEKQKEQEHICDSAQYEEGFKTGLEIGLRKQKEQKPAECIEDSVKFEEGFKAGRESGLRDGQKYVLNNLDSYGLCKPAEWSDYKDKVNVPYCSSEPEWSEEDEKNLKSVVSTLWFALNTPHFPLNYDRIIELEGWLKSFRPPLKDKEMKLKILKYLSTRCSSLEFKEVEDYLNNLRPSWKPNEEQMEALDEYIYAKVPNTEKYSKAVLLLRDELKKLM